MADAASIEQVNKIRQSLGLPLLSTPGAAAAPAQDGPSFRQRSEDDDSDEEAASTIETREAAGYENFRKVQESEKKRLAQEQRKKAIQKAKDTAAKFAKLDGRGLGDVDQDVDLDTKSWLKAAKKRQAKIEKERAEKLAKELEEREQEAAIHYTSADLAGVQVAHEIADFEDADSEQILTLQDKVIGNDDDEDEDDVLENAEVIARDKLKEKLDVKKRKAYDVHAEADGEKGLLSQYDEKKRKAFTLDASGGGIEDRETKRQHIGEQLKNLVSLDILNPEPVSDYLELKIKKPKKSSKKKSLRQKLDDDDEDDNLRVAPTNGASAMDVDSVASRPNAHDKRQDAIIDDDEDLAGALALSRRAALKKHKRKPEDIIRQLKEEEEAEPATDAVEGGLTLDETTNFLDTLSRPRDEERRDIKQSAREDSPEVNSPAEGEEDTQMGDAYNSVEDADDMLDRLRKEQANHTPEVSNTGLDEEKDVGSGLGATLKLLKERGVVKGAEDLDRNKLYRDRQKFMTEAQLREYEGERKAREQRERERNSGKLKGMSAQEREEHARWQNSQREHQSSIQAAATFNREYKPDVELRYVDDKGRQMNQKEAFKHLSHMFHGKGSGKQKTEKHLKKVDDEKRRMAASVLDSSTATGMSNAAGTTAKKNREAGVRLM